MNDAPVYLDWNATTPVGPEAVAEMLDTMRRAWANPSSTHAPGQAARRVLVDARARVAGFLGALPAELVFTSGATEANHHAVLGALAAGRGSDRQRWVLSAVEHPGLLALADRLQAEGTPVDRIPVDGQGRLDLAAAQALIGPDVALVSVMAANNEVGTVQPIAQIGALCRALGVPFHTDAVQTAGKLSLDVNALNVDALAVSAHKFNGPKGVGFLYLRQGTPFQSTQTGAGHESDRRAGTENVPLIVGMAAALALADGEREAENARLRVLRDRLIGGILEEVEGAQLTGSPTHRLDNHASFVIEGVEAEGILIGLDLAGIAASSGSACTNASQRPSHVLEALGIPHRLAAASLRLTLGYSTTPSHVETLLSELPRIVHRIRGASPVRL